MNREAVMFGLIASVRQNTGYAVERVSSRIILRSKNRDVGVVLFGNTTDLPRCVVWHEDRLVGECQFSGENGWKIFPIVDGKRSPSPLFNVDPLHFLIEEDSGTKLPRAAAV